MFLYCRVAYYDVYLISAIAINSGLLVYNDKHGVVCGIVLVW